MSTPTSAADRWLRANGFPALAPGRRRTGWGLVSAIVQTVLWWFALWTAATAVIAINAGATMWLFTPVVFIAVGLLTLALAVSIVMSGIASMMYFSITWLLRHLTANSTRMISVLPLLLVAVTFFFLTGETWQSIGRLSGFPLALVSLLLLVLAVGYVAKNNSPDLDELGQFSSTEDLRAALPRAVLGQLDQLPDAPLQRPSMRALQRINLVVVGTLGRFLVALTVGAFVTLFFIVFGFLAINHDTAAAWMTSTPTTWIELTAYNHTFSLTLEHVRVAAFLGVFSTFYFVVSSASDRELAGSLSDSTDAHLRSCLAVYEVGRAQRQQQAKH